METIIGVAAWGVIGFLVVRAIRKAIARRSEAAATATATAEGGMGAGGAGSGSAVTNIHLHIGAPSGDSGHQADAVEAPDAVAAALMVLGEALETQRLEGATVHELGAGPARMPAAPNQAAQVHRTNGNRA